MGIVISGSGNGEAIVANKVRGIRCALCQNGQTAKWARPHDDANMLALGQRTIDEATGALKRLFPHRTAFLERIVLISYEILSFQ